MQTWKPSRLAQWLGLASPWEARLDGTSLRVTAPGNQTYITTVDFAHAPPRSQAVFWSTVDIQFGSATVHLDGMSQRTRISLERSLSSALAEEEHRLELIDRLYTGIQDVVHWHEEVQAADRRYASRWLPSEAVSQLSGRRPDPGPAFLSAFESPDLREHVAGLADETRDAVEFWRTEHLESWARRRNADFLAREKVELAEFFSKVEKKPLTDEQIESVVCFDNRVRVIASAGSGKTSTMVAKAGYALRRKVAPADRILMLAFNRSAADELDKRVKDRLGSQASGIRAKTFHSFGLRVIGEATGRKPRVADATVESNGLPRMREVVDSLLQSDNEFRRCWHLFRLVFASDLPGLGQDEEPDGWDMRKKEAGFRTQNDELVKSAEELMIANWLFLHGVRYQYERSYIRDTADAAHSQYHPDFYYPDIDLYHEHWAVDAHGVPPANFTDYAQAMEWKKALHAQEGTALFETTSAGIRDGSDFDRLAQELTRHGIALDFEPDRQARQPPHLDDEELCGLLRTFLAHTKSNRLSDKQLEERSRALGLNVMRTRIFLRLLKAVRRAWQERLITDNEVDFDDMLSRATDLIEEGRWRSPYDVVMVDELQDSSVARARLVAALCGKPETYLYAVGDDWQSINRFAGSEISVMKQFSGWFGEGPTVRLERTFRSPQSICDAAGAFVTKNPNQLEKVVQSTEKEWHPPTIRAVVADSPTEVVQVIGKQLTWIDANAAESSGKKPEVLVLGRYRKVKDDLNEIFKHKWRNISVRFSTVHASKGGEADHVIIPGLTRGAFPSTKQDDSLLRIAMPGEEDYPQAEERRLFYVALTRAKRSILLLSESGRESSFFLEVVRDNDLVVKGADGQPTKLVICPQCKKNTMVVRRGSRGSFYGCSAFPTCLGTGVLSSSSRLRSPGARSPRSPF